MRLYGRGCDCVVDEELVEDELHAFASRKGYLTLTAIDKQLLPLLEQTPTRPNVYRAIRFISFLLKQNQNMTEGRVYDAESLKEKFTEAAQDIAEVCLCSQINCRKKLINIFEKYGEDIPQWFFDK